ncbi:hypothetical protein LTR36_007541 [Oleoguttula mirabilis]|uniref:Uncharacterized protein n=1 Tax=Oleoguttula mirabilis TaxID=1507867 RepID=A0AAV9JU57_9PEZI|nr:hypothetical protein LTR36_007541 [Oleoguttula mirabilis]
MSQGDVYESVMPNWLDIMALNDTPANLANTLDYAASTAHDLAESFEMQFGRKPDTWNVILRWSTLFPMFVKYASADLALSVPTFSMLIADAACDAWRIRSMWAREETNLKVKGELDEQKGGPPPPKKVKAEPKRTSKPPAKSKARRRKEEPQPNAEPAETDYAARALGHIDGPYGAASQFLHLFCTRHDIYALAERPPTWSDIAFIAGCRFERTRDPVARFNAAIPDLVVGLRTAGVITCELAKVLQRRIQDPLDATYQFARHYIDKWTVLWQNAGSYVRVPAWQQVALQDSLSTAHFLCITIADACRDIIELRLLVREKAQMGDHFMLERPPVTASTPSVAERLKGIAMAKAEGDDAETKVKADGEAKAEGRERAEGKAEEEFKTVTNGGAG